MRIIPRISDTDLLGHINNSSYFVYMEEARADFIEKIVNLPFQHDNHTFVLVSTNCDFIQQGFINQRLNADTKVSEIGNTSVTVTIDIVDLDSGEKIASGNSVMVYFDTKKQVAISLPEDVREKLARNI